jgi:hypothetical protein
VLSSALPNFWSEALQGHPNIQPYIMDQDKDVLSYLQDIKNVEHPDVCVAIFFLFLVC